MDSIPSDPRNPVAGDTADSAGSPPEMSLRKRLLRRAPAAAAMFVLLTLVGAGVLAGAASLSARALPDATQPDLAAAAQELRGLRVCSNDDLWVVAPGSSQSIPGHPELPGRLLVVGGCEVSAPSAAETSGVKVFVRDDRCPSLQMWLSSRTEQWKAALSNDSSDSSTATEPQQDDFLRDGIELLPDETGESAPFSPEECYYTTGDLPPMGDMIEQIAGLDAQLAAWLAQVEAQRAAEQLEAERLEAERAAATRRTSSTPQNRSTPPAGSDEWEEEWEEYEQYNPFDPDYEADWDETPNGGDYGVGNDIPPKPEGCGNSYSYDSRWGWSCG
jgi:hypothetical protein